MSRKPFTLAFDPKCQPGYSTRFTSLDRFTGGANINDRPEKITTELMDKSNLRDKFNSGQVPQLLPSYLNRIRGKF